MKFFPKVRARRRLRVNAASDARILQTAKVARQLHLRRQQEWGAK